MRFRRAIKPRWARKDYSFLLTLTLASLAACGGPDVGVTREEIKIGTWAPLSGPASEYSTVARAMEAYFASINARGGIHGRKLKLLIKDDAYDPARTPVVVKELVEQDQVFAICGGIGTANCQAVKDYLILKGVPWITPGSASRVWTMPTQGTIFSVFPSYVTEGRLLARYAVKELKAQKVGLFYQNDSFGSEGQEGVRLGLRDERVTLAEAVSYKVSDRDVSEQARKLMDSGVDAVIIWAIPSHAGFLVREFTRLGFKPKLLASQVLADPILFKLAGEGWEGAIVASGVPAPGSDHPAVARAREILAQNAPDVPFGTIALMGFCWSEPLIEGLRRAGPDLNRVKLIYTIEKIANWSENYLGRSISFSGDDHQGLDAVHLMKAEGGTYVNLTDWLEP